MYIVKQSDICVHSFNVEIADVMGRNFFVQYIRCEQPIGIVVD